MTGSAEAEGLTKDFRAFQRRGLRGAAHHRGARASDTIRALDQATFRIQPGEMIAYLGTEGAGKSTSIRVLSGVLEPTAGRAVVNDLDPYRDRLRCARSIGVVLGGRTPLGSAGKVGESFRLLQRIYEVSDFDHTARLNLFDQILEVKRYLDTPLSELSPAQRICCELTASLLHSPSLLLLDEPAAGLDVATKTRIREFLKELNQRSGVTVLLTTRELSDVEELCRRLMIIDRGCILFDGALAALKRQLWQKMQVRVGLKEPAEASALESLPLNNIQRERLDEFHYRLSFDREQHAAGDVVRQIVAAVEVRDILVEEESVEEIVRRIYTGPKALEFGG